MKRFVRKPSPGMIVAFIALFVALSGAGYAASKINGKNIKTRSISGNKLKNDTITGKQVRESKLGQVPSAADADKLGGNTPDQFVRGTTKRVQLNANDVQTLFDVANVGKLTATCNATATAVTLAWTNNSGGQQVVSRSRITETAAAVAAASGTTVNANNTSSFSSTSPNVSDAHRMTYAAYPSDPTQNTAGIDVQVSAITRAAGANRCIVQGVQTPVP